MEFGQSEPLNEDSCLFLSAIPSELLGACRPIRFSSGETVVSRDEKVELVYFLLSGELATFNQTADGKLSSFLTMPAPDVISDMEVLAGQPVYSANIMATKDSFALHCRAAAFEDALEQHPAFLREVARYFAKKTFRISYQRGGSAFHTGLEKVALFLLHECGAHPPAPGGEVILPHTRPAMASMIVISQKTVDRGVYELRSRGYLTLKRGKIHISYDQYRRLLSDWWTSDAPPTQPFRPNGPR